MENDSSVDECSDYQKMPILWELLTYFMKNFFSKTFFLNTLLSE